MPEIDIRLIDAPNEPALGLGEASVGPTGAAIGNCADYGSRLRHGARRTGGEQREAERECGARGKGAGENCSVTHR